MDKVAQQSVLKKYNKYVIHMRQQFQSQPMHFGLVLGAGTSVGLGFPNWIDLVKCIAQSKEMENVDFSVDPNRDAITNAERLFQAYRLKVICDCQDKDKEYNRNELIVRAGWQRIVHSALYSGKPDSIKDLVSENHYLHAFIDIIKELPMTVNYNFDDSIQRMLSESRTKQEKQETRGYTTVWNSNVYMYPKKRVIYHPNGFLPKNINEHPSEQLVFLEDSFADQLIESVNGRYGVLSNYFSHNTCLLIGLSLNDPTLKHILRNNALNFPGNFHYYVQYVRDEEIVSHEEAITNASFDVYNLITLFLKDSEIRALGQLITMNEESFQQLVEDLGLPNSYKYMLVGAVAVGKSTAMSHFRSLSTQDEWLEPMPEDMAKDPSKVNLLNIELIDKWIADQWGKKNFKLLRVRDGIHLVDRGPLDAFIFTPKGKWQEKADLTIKGISPGQSKRKLASACIIHLIGDPETMAARALATHRQTDATKLKRQQELLAYVYRIMNKGVKTIDTRNKGKGQVAKEVARIIYMDQYEEAPLNDILLGFYNGDFCEP